MSLDSQALARLLDKNAIHDALMRYCRGIDRWDVELVRSTFWPDARVDTGGLLVASGEDFPERAMRSMREGPSTATMHFVGNESVEFDGDIAHVETYMLSYMTIAEGDKEFTRVRGSRYLDRWERREGEWKCNKRVVVDDWARYDEVGGPVPRSGKYHGERGTADGVYAIRVDPNWREASSSDG